MSPSTSRINPQYKNSIFVCFRSSGDQERYDFNYIILSNAYLYLDSNQVYICSEIVLFYLVA